MSLGPLIPFLAIALITSVTGMVHGAVRSDTMFTSLSALAFITVIIMTALILNAAVWQSHPTSDQTAHAASVVRRNTRLAALIYAWGAAAMFAVYSLSDLNWRHSWQYGLAMALIGSGIMFYVYRLGHMKKPQLPPLILTILHGAAAAGGLTYLMGSGKLQTIKSDWAANDIFLWGSLGIVGLCIISAISQILHVRAHRTDT